MIASHLGHQKNKMRSKKQCMRIFYNLLDVSMVNTWILIKLVQNEKEHKRLSDFRASVAESFCKVQQLVPLKRGRPSDQLQIQLAKKKRGPTSHIPVTALRPDRVDHWPEWREARQRFKRICSKCGLHLWFKKVTNCFKPFHGV